MGFMQNSQGEETNEMPEFALYMRGKKFIKQKLAPKENYLF